MKCPFCGNEMLTGVIQSGRQIFFTTTPHKFFFVPDGSSDDEFTLSTHNWTRPTAIAYNCKNCEKVIVDYQTPNK